MTSSRKQTCRRILLLTFGLSALIDFLLDWLFYTESATVTTGLVYGETSPHVVKSLLAFSIIGSVFFVCEILCLVWEFRWKSREGNRQALASDVLSLFVVWVEDLPQISINLYLAVCREEAFDNIQLVKAIVSLIDNVFRFVLTMVEYMCKSKCKSKSRSETVSDSENKECCRRGRRCTSVLIRAGAIAEVTMAACISYLIFSRRSGRDGTYFNNVSVFMTMSPYSDAGHLGAGDKDPVVNWMQLTSVNNIWASDTNQPILFSLQYENNGTDALKLSVWENNKNVWSPPNCFVLNPNSGHVIQELNSTCGSKGYFGNSSTQAFVKFRFDHPKGILQDRILGQIFFNMKLLENGTCKDIIKYSEDISQVSANPGTIVMHYFRINESPPGNQSYLLRNGTGARFFRKEDLTDVTEAWKTCETSGSLGPALNPKIVINCERSEE